MILSFSQYNLLLYSVDGRCMATFKAYEYALGIKSVCWSPSSQFLAIGSFDEKVGTASYHVSHSPSLSLILYWSSLVNKFTGRKVIALLGIQPVP